MKPSLRFSLFGMLLWMTILSVAFGICFQLPIDRVGYIHAGSSGVLGHLYPITPTFLEAIERMAFALPVVILITIGAKWMWRRHHRFSS